MIKGPAIFSFNLINYHNHLLHDVLFMPLMAGVNDMDSYRLPSNDEIMFWSYSSLDILLSPSDQVG